MQDPMQIPTMQQPENVLGMAPECRGLSETSGGAREEGSNTRTGARRNCVLCGLEWAKIMELPRWAVAITLLVFCVITVLVAAVAASLAGSKHCRSNTVERCIPCPEGWMLYAATCYYFSDVKMNWTSSQEYCSTYNGTLAVLKSNQDLKNIERFRDNNYWVGLFKKEDEWRWLDGSPLPKDRIPLTNNDSSLGCAYLNYGHFGALHCKTTRNCLCTRAPSSCFMGHKGEGSTIVLK
ncbi:C-type lectin domain family 2 member L isoform X2 [Microcaecilia unicolor]|uniref:C-type lectin domain family 2 member L-like isoform X2 n=1 Tax=Microcaecilia unicolor TaxID=1415580 RepID=A0A6P7WY58_9AMPH|nr:C-type lectin domain family 2 member L-like isoform X2 [Microcaecilia unicolor]